VPEYDAMPDADLERFSERCRPSVPRSCSAYHGSRWAADSVRHRFLEKTRVSLQAPPRTGNVEQERWNLERFTTLWCAGLGWPEGRHYEYAGAVALVCADL